MDVLDWILVAIRWIHALAAVAWVGGGIFYVLVLRPSRKQAGDGDSRERDATAQEFRSLVNTAIGVLLLTGVILSVSRLTASAATIPYMAVLAVKIVLALYMFYTVRFLRRRSYPEIAPADQGRWARWRSNLSGTTAVLIIGVVVFGLADVLDALFEAGLAG
jgi:putative copper export protein